MAAAPVKEADQRVVSSLRTDCVGVLNSLAVEFCAPE
jgi:hypothetical protein